jgi:hypothetical protein
LPLNAKADLQNVDASELTSALALLGKNEENRVNAKTSVKT